MVSCLAGGRLLKTGKKKDVKQHYGSWTNGSTKTQKGSYYAGVLKDNTVEAMEGWCWVGKGTKRVLRWNNVSVSG